LWEDGETAVRCVDDGDETGHKRDEAAREGSLRDSRRLAFVIRDVLSPRKGGLSARAQLVGLRLTDGIALIVKARASDAN
jgi:hypothetical protein